MPRLIDANEILKSEHQHYDYMADEYYVIVRDIENAPTVDAVPTEFHDRCMEIEIQKRMDLELNSVRVVRCKDCKFYWKNSRNANGVVCIASPKDDAFCSEGERKEDA